MAEWAGMGFVIAPSPLHSAQMIPLLSAEKALVGDLGRVIFFDRIYGREKKTRTQRQRGLMHYLQLTLEQGPLQGLAQRL